MSEFGVKADLMFDRETCAKAGCTTTATVRVVLNDLSGTFEWAACWDHANAFQDWCERESKAQGGWLMAVFEQTDTPWFDRRTP